MSEQPLTKEFLKSQIRTFPKWTEWAIAKIYQYQTADEQSVKATTEENGVGFSKIDADIMSSFANQLQEGRHLTPKQLAVAQKAMPKYAGQLMRIAKSLGKA